MHSSGNSPIWQNPRFKLRSLTTMAETRESVILDITLLTRFATVQRFKDVNNSAFSRSRVDADLSAFKLLRNSPMPSLSRGFFDSQFHPRTSKGNQRSEEILDAFATTFAGSGDCVAVGVIRDWEKRVVQMIIGGNGNILPSQQQQIHNLYMGLKEIAAASERIAARQFHSTHSNVLKESPPAKTYQNDSREFNPFLLLRLPIVNLMPNPTLFTIYYL